MQLMRGATVARRTPDQEVVCSNPVGVINIFILLMRSISTSRNMHIYQNRINFTKTVIGSLEGSNDPNVVFFTTANIIVHFHQKANPSAGFRILSANQMTKSRQNAFVTCETRSHNLWIKSPARYPLGQGDLHTGSRGLIPSCCNFFSIL